MSSYSLENFMTVTPDGQHFNFWDAPFKNIHLYVSEQARVTVDAEWTANLPGIAKAYLGSEYLWWAVLMYNQIADPLNDVVPGVVLRVPNASQLAVFIQNNLTAQNSGNYLPTVAVTTL